MRRGSKRSDWIRIKAILTAITEPFSTPDMDWLTMEQKLMLTFRTEEVPIYRRKILRPMKVKGLWWMNESQWMRFMSNRGYSDAIVIKSGQDPDRVFATRSFEPSWCYIRDHGDRLDIEAISKTNKWCPKKKKNKGTAYEWMTVSITKEEYETLTPFLGPQNDGCKHHRDDKEA